MSPAMALMGATLIIVLNMIGLSTAIAEVESPVIALHVQGSATGKICSGPLNPNARNLMCSLYSTGPFSSDLGSTYTAYLVAARASEGVAGLSCGVAYADLFVGWSLCADLEFVNAGSSGTWPATGGGNRIAWGSTQNCQTITPGDGSEGIHAIAGYFYIYAYGPDAELQITPNMNVQGGPELQVANCEAEVWDLPDSAAATAAFGLSTDYNPCAPFEVVSTPNPQSRSSSLTLQPAFPNPVSGSAVIEFTLRRGARSRLDVFDSHGRLLSTLCDKYLDSGPHQIRFHGADLVNGIYYYRLSSGIAVETRKLLLLR